jgi:hypothetical protein
MYSEKAIKVIHELKFMRAVVGAEGGLALRGLGACRHTSTDGNRFSSTYCSVATNKQKILPLS